MMDVGELKKISREGFREKEGVLYFVEVPKDVEPSQHKNPKDKKSWSPWRRENYEFFKRELEGLPQGSVLLDVGAGESQFGDVLDRFRRIAADFYPYTGVNFVCDLNGNLPLDDKSVDIVILSNMLEHSAEPNVLISECRRVLRDGGIILGSVPFMIDIHQRPYDYYRYTDINLHYLLKKQKFIDIKIQPVMIPSALALMVLSSLFIQLIEKTEYSKWRFLQKICVLSLRVLWKIIRIAFKLFGPILKKCQGDRDLPLGYHFKARK